MILPTAPPWMVGSRKFPYELFHELHRDAGRGFRHLGFTGFTNDYKIQLSNGNAVAAMPSLHASFALIVPAFFLPWIKPKWLKALVLVFPVMMLAVARLPRRALGDRRSRRVGPHRRLVLVLEPHGAPHARAAPPSTHRTDDDEAST